MSDAADTLPIDTLIAELRRAKEEGATLVVLQVNRNGRATQCWPTFSVHSSLVDGVYVIGGIAFEECLT